ncbi:pentatricopeptide repeat-containing protein At2g27610-like isoform X1 [Selaginella moellendorffii]|uniref:pentatricopeptide repeat-containing protein At2g27610-like isoform X1 n=1 Tax=Selaginella moellendorffii TaxID=88036 RepID=UPI000D1C9A49|nr:pentatricopeptide repeat-containing protein At2g27610-like isoform X1 [Selaginella moellendorffii]|eukprot:XP_024521966.1 pentatricopeptide repeat-containing protein At2g27610-like isoform X1 [Selaginella moellendorffii]
MSKSLLVAIGSWKYPIEQRTRIAPAAPVILAALKACSAVRDLEAGARIHASFLESSGSGAIANSNVENSVIHMYAKCGSLRDARSVFDSISHLSVVSWNALIFGYAENGGPREALELFQRMQDDGFSPNPLTFVAALKACVSCADGEEAQRLDWLERGRRIHSQALAALARGEELGLTLANTLVHMYAKCGSVLEAREVFDKMAERDAVSWNALMFGYVDAGQSEQALELFRRIHKELLQGKPNALTYVAALKACATCAEEIQDEESGRVERAQWLEKGRALHSRAVESGHETDLKVASTLVDMYAKCGSLEDACRVFQQMKSHDVVSWNAIIMSYAQSDRGETALRLFAQMLEAGFTPNARTFVAALQACGELAGKEGRCVEGKAVKTWCLERGMEIHSQVVSSGQTCDIILANKLADMYAKCGSLQDAYRVFERMPLHDVVSYNVMLFGYADVNEGDLALELYDRLQEKGVAPNSQTYVAALKACASCAVKEEGRQVDGKLVKVRNLERGAAIHSEAKISGLEADIKVASTLVDMYAKCGCVERASQVFDGMKIRDVVSWNSIILGYTQCGEGELALLLFVRMQEDGVTPDGLAFVAALKACSCMAGKEEGSRRAEDGKIIKARCLEFGKLIYSEAATSGYGSDSKVTNTMLDTLAKCGSMTDSQRLFEKIVERDVVSWNAMILGYAQCGEPELGVLYFRRLLEEGLAPNEVTLVVVLKACGSIGGLKVGKMIYDEFILAGLVQECGAIAGSLIGFYGKCGSMVDAQEVFDSLPYKQLVTWNALLAGYAHQGDSQRVFELFESMQSGNDRVDIDGITFLSLLNVCSHAGLVSKGKELFELMASPSYHIKPRIEHYACIVDLFGRANHLAEAVAVLKTMPYRPSPAIWRTVLGACRKWKNVELAKLAFEEIQRLDRKDGSAYVLMANTYAAAGMWDESLKLHSSSRIQGAVRKAGQSWWSDGAGKLHCFLAGDSSHPQNAAIQARLKSLTMAMKTAGYVPGLESSLLHNVPDDAKESALCGHSERLAICCALVNSAPGTPIRIVKSLRVCDDCHRATAIISRVEGREIICRDMSRFHVFRDGRCSCGDFW